MITIGPFAYQDGGEVSWLQITVGDDGVCRECKQASAVGMATNTWIELEKEQWPRQMPAYDPSVSQKHFILSLDPASKQISRHYRTKNIKNPTDGSAKPIYRMTSQRYTGAYFSASEPMKDNQKNEDLLRAYWIPEALLQDQLNTQYQAWQATQKAAIWHHVLNDSSLSMPNLPLDFEKTQSGEVKLIVTNTDLNPYQQWKIKSTIYECLALLKSESRNSVEYSDALHFLIDGSEPSVPFSEIMQKNIETVKDLISDAGINRYMQQDFYTKTCTDPARKTKISRVKLEITEPGYTANIASVTFYIQQLLRAEIQQYFPDYPIKPLAKVETLSSMFKVGELPSNEIEKTVTGLSQQEITQIDHLYRLMTNTMALENLDEDNLVNLERDVESIQSRRARTEAVGSTLRLLFSDCSDSSFTSKLQTVSKGIQQIRQAQDLDRLFKQILTQDQNPERSTQLTLNTPENIQIMQSELVFERLQNYDLSQRATLVARFFQDKLLLPQEMSLLLAKFDQNSKRTFISAISRTLPSPKSELYQQLYDILTALQPFELDTSDDLVQQLTDSLYAMGPLTYETSAFLGLLDSSLPAAHMTLSELKDRIDGYHLAKQISGFLKTNDATGIITILPHISSENMNKVVQAIRLLPNAQQVTVLSALFHHKEQFDPKTTSPSDFFKKFDRPIIDNLLAKELRDSTSDIRDYYAQLSAVITKDTLAEPQDSHTLKEALDAAFQNDRKDTQLSILLTLTYGYEKISNLRLYHNQLNGEILTQKIKQCFEDPRIVDKQAVLASLLPNMDKKKNWTAAYSAAETLAFVLEKLITPQQIALLVTLFNTQTVRDMLIIRSLDSGAILTNFEVLLGLFKALPIENLQFLVGENASYIINRMFRSYKKVTTHEPIDLLTGLSEDLLDKMVPQNSSESIQEMLDNFYMSGIQVDEFPKANNPLDWQQTKDVICALFSLGGGKDVVKKIQAATSTHELKVLLLLEVASPRNYKAEYFLKLAFQRLADYHDAFLQPLSDALRTQLKFCGELGRGLALEFQHLENKGNCAAKLAKLRAAMELLPKKITELELYTYLSDPESALSQALFSPTDTQRAGLSFFDRKEPEPDFAVLKEIKTCIARLDQRTPTLARPPRPGRTM